MNVIELDRALRQLRLSGMPAVLENPLAPGTSRSHGSNRLDRVWSPEELTLRADRLLQRRCKRAAFRHAKLDSE